MLSMTNFTNSEVSEIHHAIKGQNIFKNVGVFTSNNVWGKGYPDVKAFNSHASDAFFNALNQVRQDKKNKVTSLVFTATQGQGKTHLINRIRRQMVEWQDAVFVYVNVLSFTDLDQVNFYFQQAVVDSLSRSNGQEFSQWQAIASAIVNSALSNSKDPNALISNFDHAYANSLKKGKNLIDLLIQKVNLEKNKDPYIIRAVLWTLSRQFSSYAEKWLAGEHLEKAKAGVLGLPVSIYNDEIRESTALNTVKQIFSIIGKYSSIVVCFDEIDTGERYNELGLRSSQVVATLVKSLYDTIEQSRIGKGVVLLTVMLPDTFRDVFNSLDGGITSRLVTFEQGKPIPLELSIDSQSIIDLVKLYLDDFYTKKQLIPPTPIYPFDEEQLRKYAKVEKPTVREALRWCAENFKVEDQALPDDPRQRFLLALEQTQQIDFTEALDDSGFIAKALRFGFTSLIGQLLEGQTSTGEQLNQIIIQEIVEITPKSKNKDWINFKIIGTEQGKTFKLGIMVLQYTHGLSVGAGMNRLVDYETFDLTRGCLVRSKSRKIQKTWDSFALLEQFVNHQSGEWVDLVLEEIGDLFQIYTINEQKESYQLTTEQILNYAKESAIKNTLLLEILSDPSGKIDELIDELIDDPDEPVENDSDDGNYSDDCFPDDDDKVPSGPEQTEETKSEETIGNEEITVVINQKNWFNKDYAHTSIRSFSINSNEYEVATWREFLIMTCTFMRMNHNKTFAGVLEIKGRKNPYFSKDPKELRSPEKISGSNIYVETSLSANQIVKIVHRIVSVFGYADDAVEIKLNDS
jgi:hypothetical protein